MVLSVFALSMGITAAVMPARYRKARLRLLSTALGIALGNAIVVTAAYLLQ